MGKRRLSAQPSQRGISLLHELPEPLRSFSERRSGSPRSARLHASKLGHSHTRALKPPGILAARGLFWQHPFSVHQWIPYPHRRPDDAR